MHISLRLFDNSRIMKTLFDIFGQQQMFFVKVQIDSKIYDIFQIYIGHCRENGKRLSLTEQDVRLVIESMLRVEGLLTPEKFAKVFKVAYKIVFDPFPSFAFRQLSPLRVSN